MISNNCPFDQVELLNLQLNGTKIFCNTDYQRSISQSEKMVTSTNLFPKISKSFLKKSKTNSSVETSKLKREAVDKSVSVRKQISEIDIKAKCDTILKRPVTVHCLDQDIYSVHKPATVTHDEKITIYNDASVLTSSNEQIDFKSNDDYINQEVDKLVRNLDRKRKVKRRRRKRSSKQKHSLQLIHAEKESRNDSVETESQAQDTTVHQLKAFCQTMRVLPSPPKEKHPCPVIHYSSHSAKRHGRHRPLARQGNLSPQPSADSKTISLTSSLGKISPRKLSLGYLKVPVELSSLNRISPRLSLKLTTDAAESDSGCPSPRLIKVYQSQKQSGNLKQLGMQYPCAPPSTPSQELLKKYKFIPCMTDIMAQRLLKDKLEAIERAERKKRLKEMENKLKQDRLEMKEKESNIKREQRKEIYALNKIMRELERKNFETFCRENGIQPE